MAVLVGWAPVFRGESVTDQERVVEQGAAAFIASGNAGDEGFDALARRLFAYQHAACEPYRRFCAAVGVSPATAGHWTQIPAAPAAAFKQFDLSCTPPDAATVVFHSSGTTGRSASRHYLSPAALRLYDLSLRAGFARLALPDGARLPIWALVTPPHLAPHSSLSYMIQSLMSADPLQDHRCFWGSNGLDAPSLSTALRQVREPVLLFGTAFAWVLFLDSTSERFPLPQGSRILETGGFKGRSRTVSREELYGLFAERFAVPHTHCLAEYGMSELCSQFYDSALLDYAAGRARVRRKLGPRWTRTRVINPLTGAEVALGEAGLLCHYDLANLNSVLAVCTEDMGRRLDEGFELLGRAPQSELRGCSLTAEEWQARA